MKKMRKIVAILMTFIMVMGLATTVLADGETGKITIKNSTNVTVEEKTFAAYKILDLKLVTKSDGKGYVYTVPEALQDFYTTKFSLDKTAGDFDAQVAAEIAAMGANSEELFAFAKAALAAAKEADITPATATGAKDADSVVMNNLPLGYYVIEDQGAASPISALMLDSTDTDVEITLKADQPSIGKKIDGDHDTDGSTTGMVDYNNAAIGDKVPYVLTSQVPDMTGYTKYFFVVNDTLSKGLDYNNDLEIKVGEKTLVKDTDYTVTTSTDTDGATKIEIVFKNFIQYKDQKGALITITYSATVNENAVIGTAGNPNEVILIYSSNPNVVQEGEEDNEDKPKDTTPTGETPKDETRTYVTELVLIKVDPSGKRLEGAQFTLTGTKLNKVIVTKEVYTEDENGTYWRLKDGTYTTDDPATEGMDTSKYESTTAKYKKETQAQTVTVKEEVTATATVGSDGKLTFTGLSAGEYEITEIKAPDGYNLVKDPIKVTIGWIKPEAGKTDCTWTYTWTDDSDNKTNTITVVNQAGNELPETGGIGTTIFYVVGAILVIGAAVVLITRRRMEV